MTDTFKVNIYGLDEVKKYISPERINSKLQASLGIVVLQLHNTLKTSIFQRYERPNNLDKALKRSSSLVKTGQGFIEAGLIYEDTVNNIAKFGYTPTIQSRLHPLSLNPEWGNLDKAKIRKGLVHSATVVRGQTKVLHGKYKKGGFAIKAVGRVRIVERTSKSRYPIKNIYSLNLIDMARIRIKHDPKVANAIDTLEKQIIDNFII